MKRDSSLRIPPFARAKDGMLARNDKLRDSWRSEKRRRRDERFLRPPDQVGTGAGLSYRVRLRGGGIDRRYTELVRKIPSGG